MLKFIKSLFGCGCAAGAASVQTGVGGPSKDSYKELGDLQNVAQFVDFTVRYLVDNPAAIKLHVADGRDPSFKVLNISCDKSDVGKIIGKNGKIIMSIRTLASGAASRLDRQVTVEVME